MTVDALAEMGRLTAAWLEGDLPVAPDNPLFEGGPDPETTPLIPVLAGLNRAGLVTVSSQPAVQGVGYDGAWWEQRAAAHGFVAARAIARRLERACWMGGVRFLCCPAPVRSARHPAVPIAITRRLVAGERWDVTCRFSADLDRAAIADEYEACGEARPDFLAALQQAAQWVVYDPQWGRDVRLWSALRTFAMVRT